MRWIDPGAFDEVRGEQLAIQLSHAYARRPGQICPQTNQI
jgi:hypothetical protein